MAGRGPARATMAALLVAGSSVGCSYPTGTQPQPGACTPFTVVSSTPDDGAEDVPTDTDVSLTFSDFPDPDTVNLGSVLLSSGVQTRLGAFTVDFITQSIVFGTRNLLQPNLAYLVTVLPGVQSLTGCAATSDQRGFETGAGPADFAPPPPTVPPFSGGSSSVLSILGGRCGGNCHRPDPDDGSCLDSPAMGLSLCDRDAWAALVNADATELAGMKRVLPGDPSRSYLIRKIVPGPSGGPLPTTPGHRDPPDAPLATSDQRTISDWILGGAPH